MTTTETKAPLPESVGIVVTSLTERFGLDEAKAVLVYREEYETLRAHITELTNNLAEANELLEHQRDKLKQQAADIERLRGALKRIAQENVMDTPGNLDEPVFARVAREALAPKQPEPEKVCGVCKGVGYVHYFAGDGVYSSKDCPSCTPPKSEPEKVCKTCGGMGLAKYRDGMPPRSCHVCNGTGKAGW